MSTPVKFDNPPVAEVVCGVMFGTPTPLKTAAIGLFWQEFKDKFPQINEVPPLPQVIEAPQGASRQVQINFGTPNLRTWLISADKKALIQVQQDRFLFNWKRTQAEDKYPSYAEVSVQFEFYLAEFVKFLIKNEVGQPMYKQFELTYINLIGPKNGLEAVGESGVLVDHTRDPKGKRFLPSPEAYNWSTSYQIPENKGRLHVIAQGPLKGPSNERLMRLDLVARSIQADQTDAGREAWFSTAHEWITHGFADSTAQVLHEMIWKRTS